MITQVQQNSIRINIADRGIETIDLEVEMVDHISSAVEYRIEGGMSFRDAYKATIIEFGPRGLEYLQADKNKLLIKKGLKLIAHKFVEITTPPKVFVSLLIGVLVYFVLSFSLDKSLSFNVLYYGLCFLSFVLYAFYYFKKCKIKFSQINAFNSIFGIIYYLMYIIFRIDVSAESIYSHSDIYLMSMIMIPGLIYTSFFMVLVSTNKELNQEYGDYIIATKR